MDIFIKTPNTLNFIQLKSNGLKSIQKLDEVFYIYIYMKITKKFMYFIHKRYGIKEFQV